MNDKALVKQSDLMAKLAAEFDEFRESEKAVAVVAPRPVSALTAVLNPPERLLYCTRKPGERARLVFRLSADKAEVVNAVRVLRGVASEPKASAMADQDNATKRLRIGAEYKGCPYCGKRGFVHCPECGTLSCWASNAPDHSCPGCGNDAPISKEGINLAFERAKAIKQSAIGVSPQTKLIAEKRPLLLSKK